MFWEPEGVLVQPVLELADVASTWPVYYGRGAAGALKTGHLK